MIIENPECVIDDSFNTIPDTATIYGYANSSAQAYAETYQIKFIAIDDNATTTSPAVTEPAVITLAGDANCDGAVDVADTVLVKCYLINAERYSMTKQGSANADVQGESNGINIQDAVAIQKYVLKLIDKLPVA